MDEKKARESATELLSRLYKKDPISFEHSMRVSMHVESYLKTYKASEYSDAFKKETYYGALLHDVGKIDIPDSILKKEDSLTDPEFEVMKTHAKAGLTHLDETFQSSEVIKNVILHHHAAFAGPKGYPDAKLKRNRIPIEARIVAVADVYDALLSKRSYKEKMPQAKAFKIMRDDKKLDQSIVKDFITMIQEKEKINSRIGNDIPKSMPQLTNFPRIERVQQITSKFAMATKDAMAARAGRPAKKAHSGYDDR